VPPSVADDCWQSLLTAYGSPSRGYHTLEHIGEVLRWIDRLAVEPSFALEMAAWLHDVVYDTTRDDNEAASAAWARESIGPHVATEVVDRAAALILMTASHQPEPDDVEATALADADLAILSSPPERYARYAADVRAEYATVDDASWTAGRRRVLAAMLARNPLYHHQLLRGREGQARTNVRSELAALDGPDADPAQT
jgi:predicted metal-dependent HD superfamily phosphohydrolase